MVNALFETTDQPNMPESCTRGRAMAVLWRRPSAAPYAVDVGRLGTTYDKQSLVSCIIYPEDRRVFTRRPRSTTDTTL